MDEIATSVATKLQLTRQKKRKISVKFTRLFNTGQRSASTQYFVAQLFNGEQKSDSTLNILQWYSNSKRISMFLKTYNPSKSFHKLHIWFKYVIKRKNYLMLTTNLISIYVSLYFKFLLSLNKVTTINYHNTFNR